MADRTDKQQKTIKALDELYESNSDKLKIGVIENLLVLKETKLPKKLKAILDKFKDSPLDGIEKDIYECKYSYDMLDLALKDNADIDDFNSVETSHFLSLLTDKITNHKNDKGYYKEIPSLVAVGIPKNSQIKEIREKLKESAKTFEKFKTKILKQEQDYKNCKIDSKQAAEKLKEIRATDSKMQEENNAIKSMYLKVVGIAESDITEWERELIYAFIQDFIVKTNNNSVQSPADFSPFALYLKN